MYQRDRHDWTLFRFTRASRARHPVQLGEAIPYGAWLVATRTGDFVTATRDRDGNLRGYRVRPDHTVLRRNISKATSYGDLSGLGVDRNGTAYVTYEGSARPTGGKPAEFVRPWFAGGRLGRARRITPLRHILLVASSATSWRGGTLVTWSRQVDASKGYVDGYARMLRRDGSLGAVRRLGPGRGQGGAARLRGAGRCPGQARRPSAGAARGRGAAVGSERAVSGPVSVHRPRRR